MYTFKSLPSSNTTFGFLKCPIPAGVQSKRLFQLPKSCLGRGMRFACMMVNIMSHLEDINRDQQRARVVYTQHNRLRPSIGRTDTQFICLGILNDLCATNRDPTGQLLSKSFEKHHRFVISCKVLVSTSFEVVHSLKHSPLRYPAPVLPGTNKAQARIASSVLGTPRNIYASQIRTNECRAGFSEEHGNFRQQEAIFLLHALYNSAPSSECNCMYLFLSMITTAMVLEISLSACLKQLTHFTVIIVQLTSPSKIMPWMRQAVMSQPSNEATKRIR